MKEKIKATVDTLASLIEIIESSKCTIKNMFSDIDKTLTLSDKIEQAEKILDKYIVANSEAINKSMANEHLKKATILSLTEQVERSFRMFVEECEIKQFPAVIQNRYNSENSYQIAISGDIEMCFLVAHNSSDLSSSEKIRLLNIASDGGHPEACNELSIHYSLGKDTLPDHDTSVKWADRSFELFEEQNSLNSAFKNHLKTNFDSDPENVLEKVISWAMKTKTKNQSFITNRVINNAFESIFISFPVTTKLYPVIVQNLADNYKNGCGVAINKDKASALKELIYFCNQLENFKYTKDTTDDYSSTMGKIKEINKRIISIHF